MKKNALMGAKLKTTWYSQTYKTNVCSLYDNLRDLLLNMIPHPSPQKSQKNTTILPKPKFLVVFSRSSKFFELNVYTKERLNWGHIENIKIRLYFQNKTLYEYLHNCL